MKIKKRFCSIMLFRLLLISIFYITCLTQELFIVRPVQGMIMVQNSFIGDEDYAKDIATKSDRIYETFQSISKIIENTSDLIQAKNKNNNPLINQLDYSILERIKTLIKSQLQKDEQQTIQHSDLDHFEQCVNLFEQQAESVNEQQQNISNNLIALSDEIQSLQEQIEKIENSAKLAAIQKDSKKKTVSDDDEEDDDMGLDYQKKIKELQKQLKLFEIENKVLLMDNHNLQKDTKSNDKKIKELQEKLKKQKDEDNKTMEKQYTEIVQMQRKNENAKQKEKENKKLQEEVDNLNKLTQKAEEEKYGLEQIIVELQEKLKKLQEKQGEHLSLSTLKEDNNLNSSLLDDSAQVLWGRQGEKIKGQTEEIAQLKDEILRQGQEIKRLKVELKQKDKDMTDQHIDHSFCDDNFDDNDYQEQFHQNSSNSVSPKISRFTSAKQSPTNYSVTLRVDQYKLVQENPEAFPRKKQEEQQQQLEKIKESKQQEQQQLEKIQREIQNQEKKLQSLNQDIEKNQKTLLDSQNKQKNINIETENINIENLNRQKELQELNRLIADNKKVLEEQQSMEQKYTQDRNSNEYYQDQQGLKKLENMHTNSDEGVAKRTAIATPIEYSNDELQHINLELATMDMNNLEIIDLNIREKIKEQILLEHNTAIAQDNSNAQAMLDQANRIKAQNEQLAEKKEKDEINEKQRRQIEKEKKSEMPVNPIASSLFVVVLIGVRFAYKKLSHNPPKKIYIDEYLKYAHSIGGKNTQAIISHGAMLNKKNLKNKSKKNLLITSKNKKNI